MSKRSISLRNGFQNQMWILNRCGWLKKRRETVDVERFAAKCPPRCPPASVAHTVPLSLALHPGSDLLPQHRHLRYCGSVMALAAALLVTLPMIRRHSLACVVAGDMLTTLCGRMTKKAREDDDGRVKTGSTWTIGRHVVGFDLNSV